MIVNKREFITSFLNDDTTKKSSNLYMIIDDNKIMMINYNTIIAYKKINDDKINLNIKKYSQTTSKNQNLIKRLATQKGYIIKEYI